MKAIAAALIEAQKELPLVIGKDESLVVGTTKDGREVKRGYLTLEKIIEDVRPILNKHGLFLEQSGTMADGKFVCETTIIHTSGEALHGVWPVLEAQDARLHPAQKMGMGWTYARRYSLAAILGIGTGDQDVDASEPPDEPPAEQQEQGRELTDEERERFIKRAEELGGDVEQACKVTSAQEAKRLISFWESRKR